MQAILQRVSRSLGFGRREAPAVHLYEAVVAQARNPAFVLHYEVDDTVDGRFDLIVLHMFAVLNRLKGRGGAAEELSQALFDTMFADMDRSLREMGVSDMSVGKRVRAMADGFYGRVAAYDAGLGEGLEALAAAIQRNVHRGAEGREAAAGRLAGYVEAMVASLAEQDESRLAAGIVRFPEPAA